MTEIEQKALALLNERHSPYQYEAGDHPVRILASTIEQHEAFKREVSDAVEAYLAHMSPWPDNSLRRFILPKPVDPLVEAWLDAFPGNHREDSVEECEKLRAALAKRGLEVREIEG